MYHYLKTNIEKEITRLLCGFSIAEALLLCPPVGRDGPPLYW